MKIFRSKMRAKDRLAPAWFGDEDEAVLIDIERGRLLGWYSHDGYGKWDHWLYVAYWRAWKVLRNDAAWIVSWSPFPLCTVGVFRSKSLEDARGTVEQWTADHLKLER